MLSLRKRILNRKFKIKKKLNSEIPDSHLVINRKISIIIEKKLNNNQLVMREIKVEETLNRLSQ